ncbi:dGTPase [Massilia arenosa]|uniref:dGTPase n=1 Tax=Zemynaea arenosa TaxID=2561931 RepID=A0A4Y9SAS2_9BURK|nr:dGTPase [Massilia arenosa]TFW19030.1 dGTPase [Massilia arenosa]
MTVNTKKTYSKLLKCKRTRPSSVPGRNIVTESESDRGRILFCPAFRRLQQKAQVFSMEPNAAVRSRLTHSLEVSQIGRYIADQVCEKLADKDLATHSELVALTNFVESACLMHDIGNPPFGHFGEAAIQAWFRENGADCITAVLKGTARAITESDDRVRTALADFLEFDGNPQGFRVVTKLQWNTDEYGLNLTHTTLAAYLKYFRKAGVPKDKLGSFAKKAGFFSTEAELVDQIWQTFGYKKPQRFPLAYIMEAADDIAYCISDLEDSIEKDLIDQDKALSVILKMWTAVKGTSTLDQKITKELEFAFAKKKHGEEYTYTNFRTALSRLIVTHVADRYVRNHQKILDGTAESLLGENSSAGKILKILKSYCQDHVYNHYTVERTELAGYAAIYGLLNHFKPLLSANMDRFRAALVGKNKDSAEVPILVERKFLSLFPARYIKVYNQEVSTINLDQQSQEYHLQEWVYRAHLIVDFISGMTDDFAMTTYRTYSGTVLQ